MDITRNNAWPTFTFGCCILIACLFGCERGKAPETDDTGAGVKSGYDTGYEFGIKMALQQKTSDSKLEDALKGMRDALSEAGIQISDAEMCSALKSAVSNTVTSSNAIVEGKHALVRASAHRTEDDFAALNARRDGVVVLPSTVQYEVLKAGSGRKPESGDAVLVSYQASLPDGRVFDTTYEDGAPIRMELDDIAIPGLKEALMMMPQGSQWRVVIPPKMGFGRSGNNRLRRHDVIYVIELVSIEKPKAETATSTAN